MSDKPIITTQDAGIEPLAYECKFTISNSASSEGDYMKNSGGPRKEKFVRFDGYASQALIDAVIDAIARVVSE